MLNREHIADALEFWEPARIPYNLILALITMGMIWPPLLVGALQFSAISVPSLIGLAVLANVAYCVIYPVDLLLQASALRDVRVVWRGALWSMGALLAAALAWLFAGAMAKSHHWDWMMAGR